MIGCLLALLGALAGGGLAIWYGRERAAVPPAHSGLHAPLPASSAASPALLFSPTPERPDQTPEIISSETDVIWAFYDLPGMPSSAALSASWFLKDEQLGELPLDQLQPQSGADHAAGQFAIHAPATGGVSSGGFISGIYRVVITSPDYPDISAEASFVALPRAAQILQGGGEPEGPPAVRSMQTASGVTDTGELIGTSTSFQPNAGRVVAVFHYEGIIPGSALTVRWYLEETELTAARTEIPVTAARGRGEAWLETGEGDLLPDGSYRVVVFLGDEVEPLATTGFEVASPAGSTAARQ
ncbi:MAG TPA: hypothetical protein DEP45_10680 [Armatimonadetes bacterium]|nr:hypothetical protein [Armatimonadota bacterium]